MHLSPQQAAGINAINFDIVGARNHVSTLIQDKELQATT
jgi:hypothetical protein